MGIASMIIGIIAVVLVFIPCPTAVLLFLPVLIGFILGIVDVALKSKQGLPKGCGIAGIVMNSIALIVIILWCFVFGAAAAATTAAAKTAAASNAAVVANTTEE